MRFLPVDLPTLLGYLAGLLLVTVPAVVASTMEEQRPATAQVASAEGNERVVVLTPSLLSVLERGVVAQATVFLFQIVGAVLSRFRPSFLDTSQNELLLAAIRGLATR